MALGKDQGVPTPQNRLTPEKTGNQEDLSRRIDPQKIKTGERNMTKYVDAIIRVSDSVLNAVGEFLSAPTTDKINPHLMDYAKTEYKNDWRWAYLYMVENQGKGPKSDR